MSEEVQDAATTIPKVLLFTIAINATLAFGFLVALLFCIGDINAILSTNTGYPVIALFQQATGTRTGATLMMVAIVLIAFVSGFALLASVSRLTFAFARDGGLPFSDLFAYVSCLPRIISSALETDIAKGRPAPPYSRTINRSRLNHHHAPIADQHWEFNRSERHTLTLNSGALHVLPNPDMPTRHEANTP